MSAVHSSPPRRGRRLTFLALATLTLAVGVAANLVVFALADAVLLRPLPYERPEELAVVWEAGPHDFGDEVGASLLDYRDWRDASRSFAVLAAYGKAGFNLSDDAGAEFVDGHVVSSNYFAALGAAPAMGTGFTAADEAEGAPRAVVLSDGLWRRRYGADPGVVGRTVALSGHACTVRGVMPRGFRPPERAELWLPLSHYGGNWRVWRATHPLTVFGRLAPGATATSARSELAALAAGIWSREELSWSGWSVRVVPLLDQQFGAYRGAVRALWIAVATLLLITCANLANLLLVRSIERDRELAVRAALGATRRRLVASVLRESLTLGVAGWAAGMLLGVAALRALPALLPVPVAGGGRTWIYAAAVALLSALAIGALPAWRGVRSDPRAALLATRGGSGRHRLGHAFVVLQVALAVPLLAGCLLMVRSVANLRDAGSGVRAEGVLSFRTTASPALYRDPASRARLFRQIEERLAALPGAAAAGMASNIPFSRQGTQTATSVFVEGRAMEDARDRGAADVRTVSPGALAALGLQLSRGRWIAASDLDGPRAAVLHETAARRLFGDRDPLGERIVDGNEPSSDSPDRWFTIVGVVGDARSGGLREAPVPEIYLPFTHRPPPSMTFVVRSSIDPRALIEPARDAVAAVDRRQPIFDVATLDALIDESIATPRLARSLFVSLAAIALLLAGLGTYAVAAYAVATRRRELAIRATLGAAPAALLRAVAGEGLRQALAGAAIGLVLSLVGTRVLRTVVYGVATDDLGLLTTAVLAATAAAQLACLLPARAAMRTAPAEALRQE